MRNSNKRFKKIAVLCLVFALLISSTIRQVEAQDIAPYASAYIEDYNCSITQTSAGTVKISFSVDATGRMDEIGAVSIMLFESSDNVNWKQVRVYENEDYSSMLATDAYSHSSYVSYPGTSGYYYKAYICLWAAKDGSGDSRYLWEYYP